MPLALSLGLGAAGLLPRFDVNPETTLAGGNYSDIEGAYDVPAWPIPHLLDQVLGGGNAQRQTAIGGAAVVLSLLAFGYAGFMSVRQRRARSYVPTGSPTANSATSSRSDC